MPPLEPKSTPVAEHGDRPATAALTISPPLPRLPRLTQSPSSPALQSLPPMPTPQLPTLLPRPTLLSLDNLHYAASGQVLVRGLTATLGKVPCAVILGPNGSGKTLTLRMSHGLLRPTLGEVRWGGVPVTAPPRGQALVFQHPVLLRRNALGNVRFALAAAGVPRRDRKARAEAALESAHLHHKSRQMAWSLSAGEQQRLALARAMALAPRLLLLDEPTAALDPAATLALEEHLRRIVASGTALILTTHDLAQARRLADEVLFLHQGVLLEQTPAATFFNHPQTGEARAFLQGDLLT